MAEPLISVVIDTFNQARFIEAAIDSVLFQDFPLDRVQILVVDDGSTDDTCERVKKYGSRVEYFRKPNGGQASAINFGTARAKGEIVAFLDGDDLWLPNKLSRVAGEFEKEQRLTMVYHKCCFWDVRDNWVWDPPFNEVSGDVMSDKRKLLRYWAAPTSSLAFRRKVLERVMPIPEECSYMHDAFLIATAICQGPVAAIPECLTKNRVHGENLWFAERGKPNPEVMRSRVKTREAATISVRRWVQANEPRSSYSKIRVLLRCWRISRDQDEFQYRPPGRLRFFWFLLRENYTYSAMQTWRLTGSNYATAVFALLFPYEKKELVYEWRRRALAGAERVYRMFFAGRAGRGLTDQEASDVHRGP